MLFLWAVFSVKCNIVSREKIFYHWEISCATDIHCWKNKGNNITTHLEKWINEIFFWNVFFLYIVECANNISLSIQRSLDLESKWGSLTICGPMCRWMEWDMVSQICLVGFRSGERAGQSIASMPLSCRNCWHPSHMRSNGRNTGPTAPACGLTRVWGCHLGS